MYKHTRECIVYMQYTRLYKSRPDQCMHPERDTAIYHPTIRSLQERAGGGYKPRT